MLLEGTPWNFCKGSKFRVRILLVRFVEKISVLNLMEDLTAFEGYMED